MLLCLLIHGYVLLATGVKVPSAPLPSFMYSPARHFINVPAYSFHLRTLSKTSASQVIFPLLLSFFYVPPLSPLPSLTPLLSPRITSSPFSYSISLPNKVQPPPPSHFIMSWFQPSLYLAWSNCSCSYNPRDLPLPPHHVFSQINPIVSQFNPPFTLFLTQHPPPHPSTAHLPLPLVSPQTKHCTLPPHNITVQSLPYFFPAFPPY